MTRRVRDSFLVFGAPLIEEPEMEEVMDCLRTGWIGSGPKVARFERALEAYVGVSHVRCVSSCTAALFLALRTLEIGPGDEVLVPAMTFVASANAVEQVGARPVLVDSEPDSGLMDLDAAESLVSERTRAIMPVHLAGRPVDLDRLTELGNRHGLAIVEDAAHALGTEWRGARVGGHGHLTAYSFYVTKNITTIEGGALATDDPDIADRVERLALHGLSLGAWQRYSDAGFKHYEVAEPGFKFNMTDVQAALGIHQINRLDGWIERRAELWTRYDTLLAALPVRLPPQPAGGTRHARHLYRIEVAPEAKIDRDALLDRLVTAGIGTGVHYRAVHLHPYYRDHYKLDPASLPIATAASERTLSLPLSPKVSDDDQDDVVTALTEALA